jgi:Family of unknown function (DUF5670)
LLFFSAGSVDRNGLLVNSGQGFRNWLTLKPFEYFKAGTTSRMRDVRTPQRGVPTPKGAKSRFAHFSPAGYSVSSTNNQPERKGTTMLQTIAIVLIILWLLGLVTGNTMSGFIHILLVVAIVLVLVRIIQGKKPL